jgi:HPr kinase/phosphorylase
MRLSGRVAAKNALRAPLPVWFDVRFRSHCKKWDGGAERARRWRAVSRGGDPPEPGPERRPGTLDLHASAVAVEGRGLLILGASGAGKSGLALRLMALGARLVADDRVLVDRAGAALVARAPAALAGMIEARGIGLLRAEPMASAPLALAVDLDAEAPARMPQPREITLLGVGIQLILGKSVPNLDAALLQRLRGGAAT